MSIKSFSYRLAQRLSVLLPSRSAFQVAEHLADLQWRTSAKDRQAVQHNLSLILGTPIQAGSPLVREVFRNFGRYLVEFFSIHRVPHPAVTLEGFEHLTGAVRSRRGAIAMTAHFGNWELAAVMLRRHGMPISAIALPHNDLGMDRLFTQQRARCGIATIPLGKRPRGIKASPDRTMLYVALSGSPAAGPGVDEQVADSISGRGAPVGEVSVHVVEGLIEVLGAQVFESPAPAGSQT